MYKTIQSLCVAFIMAFTPMTLVAQQTLEEATDSIKNILALAKKGDAVAQNEVGGWYYRGRHVKQNYEVALQWWAKSAKQGNTEAIGNMGLCYYTGNGIAPDSLKASQLFRRSIKDGNKTLLNQNLELAKKGNIFSNMLIASCYLNGAGVPKDPAKAVPFLTAAAEKNSVLAQRDLALLLLNGKNAKDAAKWFKKGADNQDLTCIFYYGKQLIEGLGVPVDKKEGANYMLKAAEAGFPQAMFYLGNCYMNGDGLTKNADQAVKWYKLASGAGVANAQWQLAQCYRQGIGTPVNFDQALYWYAKSLNSGHSRMFKKLVTDSIPDSPFVAYLRGVKDYMNKNYEAALKEFKIVEKAKIDDGKIMTAAILANSSYPKNNIKKGVKLLKDAAETSAQAKYLLAVLFEAGKGVDKNLTEAVNYMTQAAEAGYGPAECALADMYFEGRCVEKSYENAVKWYSQAHAQGQLSENAASRYASCYENGWGGLEKDSQKAEELQKGNFKSNISSLLSLL